MENERIFNESKRYMPSGGDSSLRAYREIGMTPPIIKSGKGVKIIDEDGNEYIDFELAYGSLLLGHCNDKVIKAIKDTAEKSIAFSSLTNLELEMGKFLCEHISNVDMVRMVNSRFEADMNVIKLARNYTKRDKIVRFLGCNEGYYDEVLEENIFECSEKTKNTLISVYNDEKHIAKLFKKYGDEIAAVIIEPVATSMGVVKANDSFMQLVRTLCNRYGALLIFDEAISGFRASFTGAKTLFNVVPDLVIYSNVMGAGFPCGAYGGKKQIMQHVLSLDKEHIMPQNPIAIAAGIAELNELYDHPEYYNHIERIGKKLVDGLMKISYKYNIPIKINRVGSMLTIFFSEEDVDSYKKVENCNMDRFKRYFEHMIKSGIYIPTSQFQTLFLSTEHNITHVYKFVKAFEEFAKKEMNFS